MFSTVTWLFGHLFQLLVYNNEPELLHFGRCIRNETIDLHFNNFELNTPIRV